MFEQEVRDLLESGLALANRMGQYWEAVTNGSCQRSHRIELGFRIRAACFKRRAIQLRRQLTMALPS